MMRRARLLIVLIAAGLAGCRGALTPDGGSGPGSLQFDAAADAGAATEAGGPGDIAIIVDAMISPPCPFDHPAPKVDGAECQFAIPDPQPCEYSAGATRDRIRMKVDAGQVPQDAQNGWTYTDATHTAVEMHGAACDLANASSSGVVITFVILI
jgi:hypothetical protein